MRMFLEEYGFVILVIIVVAGLVAAVMIIHDRNTKQNQQNFSQFTDTEDAGGKIEELKNNAVITPEGTTEEERRKYVPQTTW